MSLLFSLRLSFPRIVTPHLPGIFCFLSNCSALKKRSPRVSRPISKRELEQATTYWVSISQATHFTSECEALKSNTTLPKSSPLLSLCPFLADNKPLRVGGRQRNSKLPYAQCHPLILHSKHPVTKLLIYTEHLCLLHAGPLLIAASIGRRFHIIGGRKAIRSVTRSCVICRRRSLRPQTPLMGQLPVERISPDLVLDHVEVDYACEIWLCEETYSGEILCLRVRFSLSQGCAPWIGVRFVNWGIYRLSSSLHRKAWETLSNLEWPWVRASRQIDELYKLLQKPESHDCISNFCSTQSISWQFIPERAPHFGGLWEAAVKSFKRHLSRIVGEVKLTFEELTTVLAQIEACLNSRPLTPLPCTEDQGIDVLTPGHFLIGRPIEALPDPSESTRQLTLLRRWHLCQALVRHFSAGSLSTLLPCYPAAIEQMAEVVSVQYLCGRCGSHPWGQDNSRTLASGKSCEDASREGWSGSSDHCQDWWWQDLHQTRGQSCTSATPLYCCVKTKVLAGGDVGNWM